MSEDIDRLAALREESAALKLVLLPTSIWESFKQSCSRTDHSLHESMLLVALGKGCLHRITDPIERYLLSDGAICEKVPKQYIKGLRETWVIADDPMRRHHEAEIFRGFLTELQVAEWLETQNAAVTDLAAWGASSDIQFLDSLKRSCSAEVKYIGKENAAFAAFLEQRAGTRRGGYWQGLYDSADYFLIRAFEAAFQLQGISGRRIVCLVLSHDALHLYKSARQTGMVDWQKPELSRRLQTDGMRDLLARVETKHPHLDRELAPRIEAMAELWAVGVDTEFAFSWVERFRPAAPSVWSRRPLRRTATRLHTLERRVRRRRSPVLSLALQSASPQRSRHCLARLTREAPGPPTRIGGDRPSTSGSTTPRPGTTRWRAAIPGASRPAPRCLPRPGRAAGTSC